MLGGLVFIVLAWLSQAWLIGALTCAGLAARINRFGATIGLSRTSGFSLNLFALKSANI